MLYIYLILVYIIRYSSQCARTVDHSGSTLPPPTTHKWSTTSEPVKTTTIVKKTTTVPVTSTISTSTSTSTSTTTTPISCSDPTWILSTQPENLCFKALPIQYPAISSWDVAKQQCIDAGAVLAPMRSEQERLAIQDATAKLPTTDWPWQSETAVYFGLRDSSATKADPTVYHWTIDDSIIKTGEYTNWANTQPDRGDTEGFYDQCGSAQVYNNFKWQDILCKSYGASWLMVGVVCVKPP